MWCLHEAMQQLWHHSHLCWLVLFYSCKTICAMKGEGNLWWWHPLDELFAAPDVFLFSHFALGDLCFVLFYFCPGWCQEIVEASTPKPATVGGCRLIPFFTLWLFSNISCKYFAAREKCKQGKSQNDNRQSTCALVATVQCWVDGFYFIFAWLCFAILIWNHTTTVDKEKPK